MPLTAADLDQMGQEIADRIRQLETELIARRAQLDLLAALRARAEEPARVDPAADPGAADAAR